MHSRPLGDAAFTLDYSERGVPVAQLARAAELLLREMPAGVVDAQAAFASLTIFYDPRLVRDWKAVAADIDSLVSRTGPAEAVQRTVEIPVVYGGEFGPDLEAVARHAGLSTAAVIELHAQGEYVATAIGFVPGFAYLEGLANPLHAPRRPTPRKRVDAGSVAIGGRYTAIYPLPVPGGWNLIGRTSEVLFDATRGSPASIRVGDRVRFCQCT